MARYRRFEELFAGPLRNGINRPSAVRGEGVKMVNMGEIFAVDRIDETVAMERVPFNETEAQKFLLDPEDLLFARQSIVASGAGKCSLFLGDEEPVTWESHIIRARLDGAVANPRFYYYLFNSPSGKRLMWTIVEQVSAAGIRGSDLKRLQVPWVELEEQDRIAGLLTPYDDKIAVARRMWKALELMARALFHAWFVDYEPVRAETADAWSEEVRRLFPDQFDSNDRPAGWGVVTLGHFARRIVDRIRDPEDWADEKLIDLGRIPRQVVALDDWGLGSELTSSITRFKAHDVLFGAIRPYFHKVGLAPLEGVTNTSVMVVRARDEGLWPFVLMLCSEAPTVEYASRMAQGLKMPAIKWDDLAALEVALPPDELLERYVDAAGRWLDAIRESVLEVHSLKAARDAMAEKLFVEIFREEEPPTATPIAA
jgi:type I restriction enzyme S subunit